MELTCDVLKYPLDMGIQGQNAMIDEREMPA
jgi:hypothetical protein